MKILFITIPCFADNSFSLIHAFQQQGHDVTCLLDLNCLQSTIINFRHRPKGNGIMPASLFPELEQFRQYLDFTKFYVANFHIGGGYSPNLLLKLFQLNVFINKGNFDVIHIDHLFTGINRLLYYRFGQNMVCTIHDPLPHSGMEFSCKLQRELAMVFRLVPKIVIHNKRQKSQFCEINGIDDERVLVNNMCLYTCLNLFKKESITREKKSILFFGRISKYKGLEYLCEAMVRVHEVIPDAELIIMGSGLIYFDSVPYEGLEYIKIRNTYIDIERLIGALQRCSFVVCPYTDATQSGVIMTCNALGVPVIATNVGGLPEMIDNGYSGFVVPARDSKTLSDAIVSILQDPNTLENMYAYLETMYDCGSRSGKEIVNKYVEFYNLTIE